MIKWSSKKIFDILPPEKKYQPEIIKRKEMIEKKPSPSFFRKRRLIIIFVLFLIFFLSYPIFQKTTINIWPKSNTLSFKEKIIVDKDFKEYDFSRKTIPGNFLKEEKTLSQEFSASGKAPKEEKARGVIRVYNNFSNPQILVAGTRFQPPLDKVLYFRTTQKITIPPNSYADIEVVADRPGEEYNIGPSTFSVPGLAGLPQYYSVYGKSSAPMKGGFRGESSQITKKDLEDAERILKEKLEKELDSVLENKASEEFVLLEEITKKEIENPFFSAKEGEIGEKFTGEIKGTAQALVFRRSELERISKDLILPKIPKGEILREESLKINFEPETIDLEKGKIVLNLDISAVVSSSFDKEKLKNELAGKSLSETQDILKRNDKIEKFKIKTFPFWTRNLPKNPQKIEIGFGD